MNDLILCEACARHLRRNEACCPFCGAGIRPEVRRAAPPVAPRGLSRARLYAFHTAVATGLATNSCGTPVHEGPPAAMSEAGSPEASRDAASGEDRTVIIITGSSSSSGGVGDATTDATSSTADSSPTDATGLHDYGPIPPPYGCVFPGGCDAVRV
jgi:hypothetical protein